MPKSKNKPGILVPDSYVPPPEIGPRSQQMYEVFLPGTNSDTDPPVLLRHGFVLSESAKGAVDTIATGCEKAYPRAVWYKYAAIVRELSLLTAPYRNLEVEIREEHKADAKS